MISHVPPKSRLKFSNRALLQCLCLGGDAHAFLSRFDDKSSAYLLTRAKRQMRANCWSSSSLSEGICCCRQCVSAKLIA